MISVLDFCVFVHSALLGQSPCVKTDSGAARPRSTGQLKRLGDDFIEFSAVLGSTPDTNSASVYGDTASAVTCLMSGPPEEPVSLGVEPKRKCHLLLTPNASVARKYFSSPSACECPDGNIITVGAKCCRCAEVFFQPDGPCSTVGAKRLSMSFSSLFATNKSAIRSLWLLCLPCTTGSVFQLRSIWKSLSRFPAAVGQKQ